MKKYIAELLGTFILVFVGTGSVGFVNNQFSIGLAFGLALMVGIYLFGGVSGAHFNPAVTIAMLAEKRIGVLDAVWYILSQIVGAILGSAGVMLFTKAAMSNNKQVTTVVYGENSTKMLGVLGSVGFEILISFIFITLILHITKQKEFGNLAGIVIGLTLMVLVIFGLNLTGTSVNPARSLAPALFVGGKALSDVWVFAVAPIIGGLLGVLVDKFVLTTTEAN